MPYWKQISVTNVLKHYLQRLKSSHKRSLAEVKLQYEQRLVINYHTTRPLKPPTTHWLKFKNDRQNAICFSSLSNTSYFTVALKSLLLRCQGFCTGVMPINLKCVYAASMVINKGVWGALLAVVVSSWYSTNQTKHIGLV